MIPAVRADASEAKADEPSSDSSKLGLIAVLVDESLLGDDKQYSTPGLRGTLKEYILQFAQNLQNRTPHSKAVVMGVAANESTFKIASVLEKMYFEGVDRDKLDASTLNDDNILEDDNKLVGVMAIGDVPLPVVYEEDGQSTVSLYPYTDFYHKRYSYNYNTKRFERNTDAENPQPEVWHGVLIPSKKNMEGRQQLANYFYKNNEYSRGNPLYSQFDQRLLYANLPSLEQHLNVLDYNNYKHFVTYMEEMAYNRFTRYLLNHLAKKLEAEQGALLMDETSIAEMSDSLTEHLFKQYATDLSTSLSSYVGKLNETVDRSGRWSETLYDSTPSLITIRDEFAKIYLTSLNAMLEDVARKEIEKSSEPLKIVDSIALNINVSGAATFDTDGPFVFDGFLAGAKTPSILSVNQCLYMGSKKSPTEDALENNSQMVEANHLYNPEGTVIINTETKDPQKELEKNATYVAYGGCVYNNANTIYNNKDGPKVDLGPHKCNPTASLLPLYDLKGSKEAKWTLADLQPVSTDSEQITYRCDMRQMYFQWPGIIVNKTIDLNQFNRNFVVKKAKDINGVQILSDQNLTSVFTGAYIKLTQENKILPLPGNLSTVNVMASEVVKYLARTGETLSISPQNNGVYIQLSAASNAHYIFGTDEHVSPTAQQLKAIKSSPLTPNTPTDGKRHVVFQKGSLKRFDYLNLFRVQGTDVNTVAKNLATEIQKKEKELGQKLGRPINALSQFFIKHPELNVIEPILWRNYGIDEKQEKVLRMYLDKNTVFPAPKTTTEIPQTKPVNGYEAFQLIGKGDAKGIRFGINAVLSQEEAPPDEELAAAKAQQAPQLSSSSNVPSALEGAVELSGGTGGTRASQCGDPKGVEIWEWFQAMQCWIQKEIMATGIKVDNSCGASGADAAAQAQAELEAASKETSADPVDNPKKIPTQLDVVLSKRTLLPGERATLDLVVKNNEGQPILGYLEDPLELSLSDPAIGDFSERTLSIFNGEVSTEFIGGLKKGQAILTAKLGALTKTLTLNVVDEIQVHLSQSKRTEPANSYDITAILVDKNGQRIQGVDETITLTTVKKSDGLFPLNGSLKLKDGQGKTTFFASPSASTATIVAKSAQYKTDSLIINLPVNEPYSISLEAPVAASLNSSVEIPVVVKTVNGLKAAGFNDTVAVKLTKASQPFGLATSEVVTVRNGEGKIKIQTKGDTGFVNLIATHPKLKTGIAEIPVQAQINTDNWGKSAPLNLFASFAGFPAGDFTQNDYFAGTHLFSGKTEAVFAYANAEESPALITLEPNYQVHTTEANQQVLFEPLGGDISLQVMDGKTFRSFLTAKIPFDLSEVQVWEDTKVLKENTAYVELLNGDYQLITDGQGLALRNAANDPIMIIKPNEFRLIHPNAQLVYSPDSDTHAVELILQDGIGPIARLVLNFSPHFLDSKAMDVAPDYKTRTRFSGTSTHDFSSLELYDPRVTPEETATFSDGYGFGEGSKHMLLFAGGTPLGDAVKYDLPANAILFGDPTIKLKPRSTSSLNYDNSVGRKIYEDPKDAPIASSTQFDYNNDKIRDVAAILKDGRVRFFEGGATDPQYKDRGDLAFMADGAISVMNFDFRRDGYEDLLIATREGRLAIIHNNKEILSRTDQKLNVGKQLYSIQKADMDADGFDDLVTLDSRGDIRIFYQKDGVIPEEGQLIANYGFSFTKGADLKADIKVRYDGLQDPAGVSNYTPTFTSNIKALPQISNLQNVLSLVDQTGILGGQKTREAQAQTDPYAAAQSEQTLPWQEGDNGQTYFAPGPQTSGLTLKKSIANSLRPDATDIDLDEKLTYTVDVTATRTFTNLVIADTVPDSLSVDESTIRCTSGNCQSAAGSINNIYLFFGPFDIAVGQKISFTYEAQVIHTPKAAFYVKKLNNPNDAYLDLGVAPPFNETGMIVEHYTMGPRQYKSRAITPKSEEVQQDEIKKAMATTTRCQQLLTTLSKTVDFNKKDQKPPDDLIKQVKETCGMDSAMNFLTTPTGCSAEEMKTDFEGCVKKQLAETSNKTKNKSCSANGCFPTPYNVAFMVPPLMPFPLYAMPVIYNPFAPTWPPTAPWPLESSLSMFRLYMSPTLTGGMAIAMCGLQYLGSVPPPPPVFPIPYPPPIGNCFVIPLPMGSLPVCKKIAETMQKAVQAVSSAVNDLNSGISSLNGNNGVPVELQRKDVQGAGGLEVSLALNLGQSQKFKPPASVFSNIHIKPFDAIGGVITDWVDRQALEIINKLFTLPTIQFILPNPMSLIGDTNRLTTQWEKFKKNFKGISEKPVVIQSISDSAAAVKKKNATTKGALPTLNNYLEVQAAFEKSIAQKADPLQQLYSVFNSMPFVSINERPLTFKIPYLSSAQIRDFIRELRNWIFHIQKEVERVKDIWARITCNENLAGQSAGDIAKNQSGCVAQLIAQRFFVDIENVIQSAQKNIDVMEAWLNLPLQFIKFKQELAGYIKALGCYLDIYAKLLGGWLGTIREQLISWVELYYTLIEIVKNIKRLIKIFVDFDSKCDVCTNTRFSMWGFFMLLGALLPKLPVITFPKWPDLIVDMHDFDVMLKVDLPNINFVPEPIKLPRLPFIRLPDFPDLSLFISLPELPVLPKPPTLPDLPPLPPIPKVDLPTLPPPPKIPDIMAQFDAILSLIEKLLKIWCKIKKNYGPVPEGGLMTHIANITARPGYLIPLDILAPQIPNIPGLPSGDIKVDIKTYLGVRIEQPYTVLQEAAKTWNEWITDFANLVNEYTKKKTEAKLNQITNLAQDKMDQFSQKLEAGAESIEQQAQNAINESVGKTFSEADQNFREAEQKIQEKVDFIRDKIGEGSGAVNESWGKTVNKVSDDLQSFLKKSLTDPANFLSHMQESVNRITGDYRSGLQDLQDKINQAIEENTQSKTLNKVDETLSTGNVLKPAFESGNQSYIPTIPDQTKNEIAQIFNELESVLAKANQKVDYKVAMKKMGLKGYQDTPPFTSVDKIQWMGNELKNYADQLEKEAVQLSAQNDLLALVDAPPQIPLGSQLASETFDEPASSNSITSALQDPPVMIAQANTGAAPTPSANINLVDQFVKGAGGEDIVICRGSCLVDPVTDQTVEFISYFNDPANAQTAFVHSGIQGKSHVIYNDGTDAFLKRDLSVPEFQGNRGSPVPNVIFTLDDFLKMGKQIQPVMEAVDMMRTTLTQNGSTVFEWKGSTNPAVYGYGVEVERTITGFDADQQDNGNPDVKIILLPANADGSVPEMYVGGQKIEFGTLVSRAKTTQEARAKFGIRAKHDVLSANKLVFGTLGGAAISVTDNTAIYVDLYNGDSYNLALDNGYYYIRMAWFDQYGRTSTFNQPELLNPQVYADSGAPIDTAFGREFLIPLYKSRTFDATEIYTDLTGNYEYAWDVNQDGVWEGSGSSFELPAQKEPRTFNMNLIAGVKLSDPTFERFVKQVKVKIYTPKISLNEDALKKQKVISGILKPEDASNDLSRIPFSVFRKRWGVWKNLGIQKKQEGKYTNPALDENKNYYTLDGKGNYRISGLTSDLPSAVKVQDASGKVVAHVVPETGQIDVSDSRDYTLKALPASRTLPTRVAVIEQKSQEIVANIYYIPDPNTDVAIKDRALGEGNIEPSGVTIGDVSQTDGISAGQLPGFAPSFPGGAGIYNKLPPQRPKALINVDGDVRILETGYKLGLKNAGKMDEKLIFQLLDPKDHPLFDIFIAADFNNLMIKQEEVWSDGEPTLGYLAPKKEKLYSPLVPTEKPAAPVAPAPFSDVSQDNPYFRQILDLYNRRVIQGYEDGTFRPNAQISRAEFVKIALGSTNCLDCTKPTDPQRAKYDPVKPFPDVPLLTWYYYCVSIGKELGMITGYGDGQFRPERNISRAEAAAVLLRQSSIQLEKAPEKYFQDVFDSAWYKDYVYTAVKMGLIKENFGFVFPDQEITRGEFAFMASTVLNLASCRVVDTDKDGAYDWWEAQNNKDPLSGGDITQADKDKLEEDLNKECPCRKNPNRSDTDKDGLIDVCDNDLDADTILNDICIFNDSGTLDLTKLRSSSDNCVFESNPDQLDSNQNGVGDACDEAAPVITPQPPEPQNDCIIDEENPDATCDVPDLCPAVPEDRDGIDDDDGCPEVDDETPTDVPGVYVNKGPLCKFLDYESDLMPGDTIMTAITDIVTHDTVFEQSNPVQY